MYVFVAECNVACVCVHRLRPRSADIGGEVGGGNAVSADVSDRGRGRSRVPRSQTGGRSPACRLRGQQLRSLSLCGCLEPLLTFPLSDFIAVPRYFNVTLSLGGRLLNFSVVILVRFDVILTFYLWRLIHTSSLKNNGHAFCCVFSMWGVILCVITGERVYSLVRFVNKVYVLKVSFLFVKDVM